MKERILLVGVRMPRESRGAMFATLCELGRLVDTAGGEVSGEYHCELKRVDPATVLGSGTVRTIAVRLADLRSDGVAIDMDLSPAQGRNLNDSWGIKVLDRTAVILDIFARRAHTREGKLQVELAQLRYRLPRLSGKGLSLSQQAGYIGNRGPGETKLEIDRRRVRERIAKVRANIAAVKDRREEMRRKRSGLPVIALVGYTNAGKSSLLNALTSASVLVEDKLFATLDPVSRRLVLPSRREIVVVDTVGFIRKLPHELVEAFKSTFEEVSSADLILHVIDASEPEAKTQMNVVEDVLMEMGLAGIHVLNVFNKTDKGEIHIGRNADGVWVSAARRTGLEDLLDRIDTALAADMRTVVMRLPHCAGDALATFYTTGRVHDVRHTLRGIMIKAQLPESVVGKYRQYMSKG